MAFIAQNQCLFLGSRQLFYKINTAACAINGQFRQQVATLTHGSKHATKQFRLCNKGELHLDWPVCRTKLKQCTMCGNGGPHLDWPVYRTKLKQCTMSGFFLGLFQDRRSDLTRKKNPSYEKKTLKFWTHLFKFWTHPFLGEVFFTQ